MKIMCVDINTCINTNVQCILYRERDTHTHVHKKGPIYIHLFIHSFREREREKADTLCITNARTCDIYTKMQSLSLSSLRYFINVHLVEMVCLPAYVSVCVVVIAHTGFRV